jgi:trans-2,3-dihydro-3-hydroxyanthranilate isomerase
MPEITALPYRVVDVFGVHAYAGNPLAVVYDADALPTEAMQAMAREFNLSETVFVLPVSEAGRAGGADYRLRIFTPSVELPFAGHPSIGGAWSAREDGHLPADAGKVVQECGAGLLPVSLPTDGGNVVRLAGGTPSVGEAVDPGPLLAAVGLGPADGDGLATAPPRWCGGGISFGFLRVREESVAACRPDIARIAALGGAGLMVFSWEPDARHAHARVFAAGAGVPEDPATGSAAIGLGIWLAVSGLVDAVGVTAYSVGQGIEMGRPSQLFGEVTAAGGRPVAAAVAGAVVPVAEGRIRPPGA